MEPLIPEPLMEPLMAEPLKEEMQVPRMVPEPQMALEMALLRMEQPLKEKELPEEMEMQEQEMQEQEMLMVVTVRPPAETIKLPMEKVAMVSQKRREMPGRMLTVPSSAIKVRMLFGKKPKGDSRASRRSTTMSRLPSPPPRVSMTHSRKPPTTWLLLL